MIDSTTTSAAAVSGSNLRAELMKLVAGCPADACNPADCPLFHVRQLNDQQRLQWFDSLTLAEMEYLACYHYVCLKLKLEAPSGQQTLASSLQV